MNSIVELRAKLTLVTFQITFCCFSLDSQEFLHVALNSFRKCCSNVSFPVLLFLCNKNL